MDRWKVLIVDDQKEITESLSKQLSQHGFKISTAHTFTEANFIIEHYNFDIAILDILLPDGNGIDLFRSLRRKNNDIYTIMITGDATVENAITALNEGVNAYLIKPFSDKEIDAILNQAQETLGLKAENQALFQEIQNNRQFYENLLNSSSEAILVVDLDYRIQYCNEAAQQILQTSEDQLLKQLLHQFMEDGYKVLSHIYQQLVLGKPVAGYRVSLKTPAEKSFDAHMTADFLHDKNGRIDGLIINLSNPMVHDEVFNRILRKEKTRTIVNLANSLAHEIKNPLNIMYGRLQLLAEEMKDDNFNRAFESIQRQIERIMSITELLGKFNFSREDSIPENIPIVELFTEILREKNDEFIQKNISLAPMMSGEKYQVDGNRSQFSDAFRYLLDTVIEFTPTGKQLEISGKMTNSYSKTPWYEIQILLPEVRVNFEQLIDPYQALDMEVNGLVGLGMTIANTIFNNYGTKIDSVLQNGDHTILRIRFPVNIEAKTRLPRKKAAKK